MKKYLKIKSLKIRVKELKNYTFKELKRFLKDLYKQRDNTDNMINEVKGLMSIIYFKRYTSEIKSDGIDILANDITEISLQAIECNKCEGNSIQCLHWKKQNKDKDICTSIIFPKDVKVKK
jgi:hypothetical protein